jgi:hypothetical protein
LVSNVLNEFFFEANWWFVVACLLFTSAEINPGKLLEYPGGITFYPFKNKKSRLLYNMSHLNVEAANINQ